MTTQPFKRLKYVLNPDGTYSQSVVSSPPVANNNQINMTLDAIGSTENVATVTGTNVFIFNRSPYASVTIRINNGTIITLEPGFSLTAEGGTIDTIHYQSNSIPAQIKILGE